MGTGVWNMVPDLSIAPPGPAEPWDPARGLLPAQAAYCFRRALELNPAEAGALVSLYDLFKARGMHDARQTIVELMLHLRRSGFAGSGTVPETAVAADLPLPSWHGDEEFAQAIAALLGQGRPEAAVRLFQSALNSEIEPVWPAFDRVATALLHLGRPAEARSLWERAQDPPSAALRQARIAACALAALDFETAVAEFHRALDLEPGLAEAWFGLALLHTQRGDAALALAAARTGASLNQTPAQKAFLSAVDELVSSYAAE